MCWICDKARRLPQKEALELIASAIRNGGAKRCLDQTVGELVGEPEPEVDKDAESAWERGRRGTR